MAEISNVKYLSINQNFFNPNFIYYDIHGPRSNKFIGMTYKTPTIFLDGLMFETPWMKVANPIEISGKNMEKSYIELTFINNNNNSEIDTFYSVINGIDKHSQDFLRKQYRIMKETPLTYKDLEPKLSNVDDDLSNVLNPYKPSYNDVYCHTLKIHNIRQNTSLLRLQQQNIASSYKTPFEMDLRGNKLEPNNNISTSTTEYNYIRCKISNDIQHIKYNNEIYDRPIHNLLTADTLVKAWIVCYGMWKYNGKLGMLWTIVKMNVKDNITNMNIDDFEEFDDNDDDDDLDDIPNFEMDNDPDLID